MKTERDYPRFTVTRKGCAWAAQGHPWIYAQEIMSKSAEPENGSLADAVGENGRYIGTGLYSRESKIGLRLISRNANDRFDEAFWRRRVNYAWSYRRTVMGRDASCCRVIFGEADGFPGLTVDRFSNILVTQTLSVGMERLKDVIFPLLVAVLRESGETIDGIYERNDVAIRALEGLEQGRGWYELPGETHPDSTVTEICENGIYYAVDFENGQKTGFFLDQKYNRRAVGRLAKGKTVLDCRGPPRPRLLYAHGLFRAQCRDGRRGACDGCGCVRSGDSNGQRERPAQRYGGQDGLCRGGCIRPAAGAEKGRV